MGVVEVVRGGAVESRHNVHVVVSDSRGAVVASVGDPTGLTYYRSAAKPIQALPLVEEGLSMGQRELLQIGDYGCQCRFRTGPTCLSQWCLCHQCIPPLLDQGSGVATFAEQTELLRQFGEVRT